MASRSVVALAGALSTALLLVPVGVACEPAPTGLRAGSAEEFGALEQASGAIDLADVDYGLLAEAVHHETNERRGENGLAPLEHLQELDLAACGHAEAMVERDFFSHTDPDDEALATPADRVRAQGLELGFVAENIGEVFALEYEAGEPVHTREDDGTAVFSGEPGGEPLARRSYLEVASALLDNWMASSGHRENVLREQATHLGAGCRLGRDGDLGMPKFTCVQLLFTPR